MELLDSTINLISLGNASGQAEIADLDLTVVVHEDVCWFEVSVDEVR